VDKLVKDRWLTQADSRKIKQDLAAAGGRVAAIGRQ
jgi:hypothetical protein